MPSYFSKVLDYLKMIKFSHSLFSLPFAFSSFLLAVLDSNSSILRILELSGWIFICLITARSAAMGFNRYLDSEIDSKNPRTRNREIPKGIISKPATLLFTFVSSILFVAASYKINQLCFFLSFPALCVLLLYSLTKRFTFLCHLILGVSLALAPIGAWLAVKEEFSAIPFLLAIALLFSIAGFDVYYAIQDMAFDVQEGLFSIPASFGRDRAIFLAASFQIVSILFYFGLMFFVELGIFYFISVVMILCIYIYHYRLGKKLVPNSFLPPSFYSSNALVGFLVFFGILLDKQNMIREIFT